MASNTTEELKAPKVVSAYTKKKAEPCDFLQTLCFAQMDGKGHMASNTTEELKAPKVVSAYTKKKAEPCDFLQTLCFAQMDGKGQLV